MFNKQSKFPAFLNDLLEARSPSGHEYEAQCVIDSYMQPMVDDYSKDTIGNRFSVLKGKGKPTLMLSGHMDEIGFMVTYIDDQGFLYFDVIGGHDKNLIPGRRVSILAEQGSIVGVTGKRAVHLMSSEERSKVPDLSQMWIDIGAKNGNEAKKMVRIGDPIVYKQGCEILRGSIGIARAFDNKSGCYAVCETVYRLANSKKILQAKVIAAATTQEEVGTRGAITAAYSIEPDIAIAVDVGHATDHPDCDKKKFGEIGLGKGPILCRGVNINPWVHRRLVECAQAIKIPYQIEADPRPTGTDARSIQISRNGVATGLVSIPLRYMHTPSELVDLEDIEASVQLLMAFAESLTEHDRGNW